MSKTFRHGEWIETGKEYDRCQECPCFVMAEFGPTCVRADESGHLNVFNPLGMSDEDCEIAKAECCR